MQSKTSKVPLSFTQRFSKNILIGNLLLISGILIATLIDWNYSVLLNVFIGIALAVGFRMGLLTFLLDVKDHRQFIQWLQKNPNRKVIFYRKNKRPKNLFFVNRVIPVFPKNIYLCNQHRGTIASHIRRQFFMFKTIFKRPLLITVETFRKTDLKTVDQDQINYFTITFTPLQEEVQKAMNTGNIDAFKHL